MIMSTKKTNKNIITALIAPAGSQRPTGQQLAMVLIKHDLVSSEAVDDPEGYDNYKTLEALNAAARDLANLPYP